MKSLAPAGGFLTLVQLIRFEARYTHPGEAKPATMSRTISRHGLASALEQCLSFLYDCSGGERPVLAPGTLAQIQGYIDSGGILS